MTTPTLYLFSISHYCEKARWALETLGVDHKPQAIAPGLHQKKGQKLGLRRGSVPFIVSGETVVQGSSAIIDWAEAQSGKSLTPSDAAKARDMEKRLDDITGVHIRRMFYSEAIVHHPETIRPIFEKNMGLTSRLFIKSQWKKICKLMIKGMDLGDAQRVESQKIIEGELDWLDGLLSDGRKYLLGDQVSRVDITAASLMGPLVDPLNHPAHGLVPLPPITAALVKTWQDRPTLKYISRIYAEHR